MSETIGTTPRIPAMTPAAPAPGLPVDRAEMTETPLEAMNRPTLPQDQALARALITEGASEPFDVDTIEMPDDCPENKPEQTPPSNSPTPVPASPEESPVPVPAPASPVATPAPSPASTPLVAPTETAPPATVDTPSSLPENAIIIGNKRRPRTVRSFLKHMKKRGIELPFDINSLPKELLQTKLKKGQSLAISADGKPLGFLKTEDVMGNQSLGVSDHLSKNRLDVAGGLPRYETLGEGGSISVGGQEVNVVKTYLKSPIMLDLTGDGQLGTTGNSTAKERIDNHVGATVQFDVDGDGVLDNTEWMSGNGDGMLVDDRDGGATRASQGDGRIDGTRLFGDEGGKYANGYDKLAQHDTDGDGKLTGQELEGLKVWVDNGDATLEAGELKSLAELGITEMNVQMTLEKNARGEDLMRSTFVRDGKEQVTEDVWFNTKQ